MSAGSKPPQRHKAFGQAHGHADRPADAVAGSQPDQDAPATIFGGGKSLMVHVPASSTVPVPAWVRGSQSNKMTAVSPTRWAAPMILPYTLTGDLAKEVQRRR